MMQIQELLDEKEINRLALLHKRAFPAFFLTQLGLPFLRTLYKGYLDDTDSGIIIAVNREKVVGFIAYSNDYSSFYKGLLRHRIIQFGLCAYVVVLRHPSYMKRIFGAFKKSESVAKSEKYVELASICVEPEMSGQGIGSALIEYLKSIVDFKFYSYINLETDADDNEAVNQFYIKNGFTLERLYTTPEGRRMNEYHYRPKSE